MKYVIEALPTYFLMSSKIPKECLKKFNDYNVVLFRGIVGRTRRCIQFGGRIFINLSG